MPIYTYECEECGVRFDARQKFSDSPLAECPECGSRIHRVPQPVGIVFKGSGWYVKDSKGQNTLATPGKRERDSADTPAAKSETKPEASKPDTSAATSSNGSDAKSD